MYTTSEDVREGVTGSIKVTGSRGEGVDYTLCIVIFREKSLLYKYLESTSSNPSNSRLKHGVVPGITLTILSVSIKSDVHMCIRWIGKT